MSININSIYQDNFDNGIKEYNLILEQIHNTYSQSEDLSLEIATEFKVKLEVLWETKFENARQSQDSVLKTSLEEFRVNFVKTINFLEQFIPTVSQEELEEILTEARQIAHKIVSKEESSKVLDRLRYLIGRLKTADKSEDSYLINNSNEVKSKINNILKLVK